MGQELVAERRVSASRSPVRLQSSQGCGLIWRLHQEWEGCRCGSVSKLTQGRLVTYHTAASQYGASFLRTSSQRKSNRELRMEAAVFLNLVLEVNICSVLFVRSKSVSLTHPKGSRWHKGLTGGCWELLAAVLGGAWHIHKSTEETDP